MWSDRTPPALLADLVSTLHSVLPAPRESASSVTAELSGSASLEQVAEVLRHQPGFTWLNRSGPCLLHNPLVTVTYANGKASVTGPSQSITVAAQGFDILRAMFEAWHGPSGALLAGFLGYELAAEIEDLGPLPSEEFSFPQFHFALFDSALVWNGQSWSLHSTDAWRSLLQEDCQDLLRRAEKVDPRIPDPQAPSDLHSRPDREGFEAAVGRVVETIYAGDIFQTNLCRSIETPLQPEAEWDLFRRMRAINPARYESFFRIDDQRSVFSISPEMFLKVENRIVESSPIKGTRPRASSPGEDQALVSDLLTSEKDRAELAMIVDVVRNDLGRVCQTGSVKVTGHAELMSLPTVHHLVSTVRGHLSDDAGPIELLRAAFPAASISGAPKIQAMRIAMREEGQRRGPCMGAIGWISMDGNLELSVAIRTAFVTGGRVRYYAGCGITAGSVPETEFRESSDKAAAFLRALHPI